MSLILCDFDGPLPPNLLAWVTQCCHLWRWPLVGVRFDKTRRGWHVVVGVRGFIPLGAVIAAQTIFGSDRKREMLNLMRSEAIRSGRVPQSHERYANVLFASHSRGVKLQRTVQS